MNRQDGIPLWFMLLIIVPFIFGYAVAWGEFIYDLKCGFAECRILKENEE